MSHERDELAQLIDRTINQEYSPGDDVMGADLAPAILAAGYRRPRTITTVEELDALPTESVVRSRGQIVWEKFSDEDDIVCWRTPGSKAPAAGLNISLPATVLHEPEATNTFGITQIPEHDEEVCSDATDRLCEECISCSDPA